MATPKLFAVFIAVMFLCSCLVASTEVQGLWSCIRPCAKDELNYVCKLDCLHEHRGTGSCIPKRDGTGGGELLCCCDR
ncbi:hypothetical protein SDJN03_03048, partial [Cucurbita argyrosperma subsp. sororia]